MLVNRDSPVSPDCLGSMEIVKIAVEEGFSVPLEKETAEKYLQLKHYLSSLGIHVEVLSGYRFQETQERIWNESVAAHGEAYTERYVAKPGYSEHQTGLALDVTLYDACGFFIDQGKVLAHGTHEELMETCDEYRELYQAEQIEAAY